jgi:hypothetical protein
MFTGVPHYAWPLYIYFFCNWQVKILCIYTAQYNAFLYVYIVLWINEVT